MVLFLLVPQNLSAFAEEISGTAEEESVSELTDDEQLSEEQDPDVSSDILVDDSNEDGQETELSEQISSDEEDQTVQPEQEPVTVESNEEEPVIEEAVPENTAEEEVLEEVPVLTSDAEDQPEEAAVEEIQAEETEPEEAVIIEGTIEDTYQTDELADSDTLLESYLYRPVSEKADTVSGRKKAPRYNNLSDFSAAVYSYLSNKVAAVANGSLASAEFRDTEELLANIQTSYTAEELGVSSLYDGNNISSEAAAALGEKISSPIDAAIDALMLDKPYDLYWYDKTKGISKGYSYGSDGQTLSVSNLYFTMKVSSAYSADGAQNTTAVDTAKTTAAANSVQSAANVVSESGTLSDYEKLVHYKDRICELTSYNHAAADDNNTPYGDPWQLIYVFDGDPNTTVVCEGYSKAFKYLCDLTTFNNSNVEAFLVDGTMGGGTGAGPHMWNIVHMNDGSNYLVDVTNCDEGSVGYPDLLFMKAPASVSSDKNTYGFNCGNQVIEYTYGTDTLSSYSSEERNLASSDYDPEGAVGSDFQYSVLDDGTVTITGYSGSDTVLVLPSEIDGKTVTGLQEFAFFENTHITGITISDHITAIEGETFSGCTSLESISIPASVTNIEVGAFNSCSSLSEITVSSDNPVYDSRNNCNAIIETASNTLILGGKNTVIPQEVNAIGSNAFNKRKGLTGIDLPEGLTSINYGAFMSCEDLTGITLPESLTTLSDAVFRECTSLESLTIPKNVAEIGGDLILNCTNLTELKVDPENSVYDSRDNCNAVIETASNTLLFGCKTASIPSGVTKIGGAAFYQCKGLTSVTIPEGVTEIGNWSFGECPDLESVTLPASIIIINYGAFGSCPSLTDVYYSGTAEQWNNILIEGQNDDLLYANHNFDELDDNRYNYEENDDGTVTITGYSGSDTVLVLPSEIDGKTVTGLRGYSFYGNTHITGITLSDHITAIEDETFSGCTSLESIIIPASVTSIEVSAFNSCSSLSEITVSSDNPVYDSRNNCNAIIETASNTLIVGGKNTVIPQDTTIIGYNAFSKRKGLTGIDLPEGLTGIESGAFMYCEDLTWITLPESITMLSDAVFRGCTSLESLTIPKNVAEIGGDLILNCTNLTELKVDPENSVYDSRDNCNAVIETASNTLLLGCKTSSIPSGVTKIGGAAFYQCKGLTSVTMPDGVTEIGNWAFRECSDLESVTLPASITTIYYGAFGECPSLTDVYYSGTAEQWSSISVEGENDTLLNANIHYNSVSGPEQLETPEDLRWEGKQVSWKTVPNAIRYRVAFVNSETGSEAYWYITHVIDADRGTYWVPSELSETYDHGWKFTVIAYSDDPSRYTDSETAVSEEKIFEDRHFTSSRYWLHLDTLNVSSIPYSFTYLVNGEPGDPRELEFKPEYPDALEVDVDYDNFMFSVVPLKYGDLMVSVLYDGWEVGSFEVETDNSSFYVNARRKDGVRGSILRVGTEYEFDITYMDGEQEGNYSELSFDADENMFDITVSDEGETLTVKPLTTGWGQIQISSEKCVNVMKRMEFNVKEAVPAEGKYYEIYIGGVNISESWTFHYLDSPDNFEDCYYINGVQQSTRNLTYTFTDPSIADFNEYEERYIAARNYGETDLIISDDAGELKRVHLTAERPDASSVRAFRGTYNLSAGETDKVLWYYSPYESKPAESIEMTSSDSEVVTVDNNGNLTAVSDGTAVITASFLMPNGNTYTFNVNVVVGENYEVTGDGSSTPYINAATLHDLGNNKYEIVFRTGYPTGGLTEDTYIRMNFIDIETGAIFPDVYFQNDYSCQISGNTVSFDEVGIRKAIYLDVLPAGRYEVQIYAENDQEELYYAGKMTVDHDITGQTPEDLVIEASDDGYTISASCGDNDACNTYLHSLYDNQYDENKTYPDNYSWTQIRIDTSDYSERITISGNGGEKENYLVPSFNSTGDRIVSLKIPVEIMDKYGVQENDYFVRFTDYGGGYVTGSAENVHLRPTETAKSLIPQNMKWNPDGTISFKLGYGTWYNICLKNKNWNDPLWQTVNVVSDELGTVSYDLGYLLSQYEQYYFTVKTALAEEDVTNGSREYKSFYYSVPANQALAAPTELVWEEDGSISWQRVNNTVYYYVLLYNSRKDYVRYYYTAELSVMPDWDKLNAEYPDDDWCFSVQAIGDQKNYANSAAVYSTLRSESFVPTVPEELPVTVNLDGKLSEGITNVLFRLESSKTEHVCSISPSDNKLKGIRFTKPGEFTYLVYLAQDNPSVIPNYDTYSVSYTVTENNGELKVSDPVIKDNDGNTAAKIVFDLVTPKPAEYAPEVKVTLNGQPVSEAGLFTVNLKDDEGIVIQQKQNDSTGTVKFDNIDGLDDAQYYFYHLEAVVGEGYVIDSAIRHININNSGYTEDAFLPDVTYLSESETVLDELVFNYAAEDYAVKADPLTFELTQDDQDPVGVFYYEMMNLDKGMTEEYFMNSGRITEKEIVFTAPGTYHYGFCVKEDNPGLKYDGVNYYAEYVVEETNGALRVVQSALTDESGNEVTGFKYTVTSKTPVSFTPIVKVRLDGEVPADGLFTFVLKDDEGIVQDDVKVNAGENIPFEEISFNKLTFKDIGNYYYSINQQGTDGQYILDKTIYHIVINVEAGEDALEIKEAYYDYTENDQDYLTVEEPVYQNERPDFIPLESISLNTNSLEMIKGESCVLTVSYEPEYTTDDKTVAWTSSNEAVAAVNDGTVTAVGAGTATITAKVGEKTATAEVTVSVPIENISLDKTEVTLVKGKTEKLTLTITPEDTTEDKTVTWISSNEAVAAVNDGTVTAVGAGTATITAKVGEKTATAEVTVIIPIEKISLDKSEAALKKGETVKLTVTITPEDTTEDKTVTWTSSDEAVVTVNDGTVTAVGGGTATITAKVGEKTATAEVTVNVPLESISLDKSEAALKKGETVKLTVTITPEDTTEDKTVTWTSSNEAVATVTDGTVTAVRGGTATITAKVGEKTATAKIEVDVPIESVKLNKQELKLAKGKTETLTVTIMPEDATHDKTVTWISSDEAVATVENGKVTAVNIGKATITAKVGDFADELECELEVQFSDVTNPDVFYYDYVYDMAERGIVGGYADGTFRPTADCNRAAVVTFLWRLSGKPEPSKLATFKDMTGNSDFDKAISWAAENNITTGWADNTFRPWNTCNRAAVMTFLWRAAGKPEPTKMAEFTDMTGNKDFDTAISWASEKGITTGWADGTFRPWNTCNRLAVVSFLARYDALKSN